MIKKNNMTEGIGIIIQARVSSTRLPQKIILKVDEEKTFLDILLLRLKKIKFKIPIILATSDLKVDDVLCDFAKKHKIKFYRGSEENVLNRFIDCAEENKLESIIRICSDNPFLDINYVEKLIKEYKNEDYLSFLIGSTPSVLTHYGFFAELVSLKSLKKVVSLNDNNCIEHVTNCVYKNPTEFNVKFLNEKIENKGVRCTLDTKWDFEILKDIYENFVKSNSHVNYTEIIRYIESRPDLLKQMIEVIKKNKK